MTLTALLVTTMLIVAACYDGVVVYLLPAVRGNRPCVDRSISRFMQRFPTRSPFVILVLGFVMGHFFGFMPCPECPPQAPVVIPSEPDTPAPQMEELGPWMPVLERNRV